LIEEATQQPVLTLVFDIDEILADHEKQNEGERLYTLRKSTLITAEHQIFPGAIELMQYLHT